MSDNPNIIINKDGDTVAGGIIRDRNNVLVYQEFLKKYQLKDCQIDHELHIPRRTLRSWRAGHKIPSLYFVKLIEYYYATEGYTKNFEGVTTYREFMEKFPKAHPIKELNIPRITVGSWRTGKNKPLGYFLYLLDYFYSTGGHIDA